jgi:hypothetical protein
MLAREKYVLCTPSKVDFRLNAKLGTDSVSKCIALFGKKGEWGFLRILFDELALDASD